MTKNSEFTISKYSPDLLPKYFEFSRYSCQHCNLSNNKSVFKIQYTIQPELMPEPGSRRVFSQSEDGSININRMVEPRMVLC